MPVAMPRSMIEAYETALGIRLTPAQAAAEFANQIIPKLTDAERAVVVPVFQAVSAIPDVPGKIAALKGIQTTDPTLLALQQGGIALLNGQPLPPNVAALLKPAQSAPQSAPQGMGVDGAKARLTDCIERNFEHEQGVATEVLAMDEI